MSDIERCEACGGTLVEGIQSAAVYECASCGALYDHHLNRIRRPVPREEYPFEEDP